jgi:hypothetical protein
MDKAVLLLLALLMAMGAGLGACDASNSPNPGSDWNGAGQLISGQCEGKALNLGDLPGVQCGDVNNDGRIIGVTASMHVVVGNCNSRHLLEEISAGEGNSIGWRLDCFIHCAVSDGYFAKDDIRLIPMVAGEEGRTCTSTHSVLQYLVRMCLDFYNSGVLLLLPLYRLGTRTSFRISSLFLPILFFVMVGRVRCACESQESIVEDLDYGPNSLEAARHTRLVVEVAASDTCTVIKKCTFLNLVSSDSGGAVSVTPGSVTGGVFLLEDSRFTECSTTGMDARGGCVHVGVQYSFVRDTCGSSCTAYAGGTFIACLLDADRIEIRESTMWNCSGQSVIFQKKGNTDLRETNLSQCTAAGYTSVWHCNEANTAGGSMDLSNLLVHNSYWV